MVMGQVGLGSRKRFQTSNMAHLGCLRDGELLSVAGNPHESLTPTGYRGPANGLWASSGPLRSCLFSRQVRVMVPRARDQSLSLTITERDSVGCRIMPSET